MVSVNGFDVLEDETLIRSELCANHSDAQTVVDTRNHPVAFERAGGQAVSVNSLPMTGGGTLMPLGRTRDRGRGLVTNAGPTGARPASPFPPPLRYNRSLDHGCCAQVAQKTCVSP